MRPARPVKGRPRLGIRRRAAEHVASALAAATVMTLSSSTRASAEPLKSDATGRAATAERGAGARRAHDRAARLRAGALVGIGFPRPFAIEAFAKVDEVVGVGFEYSFLPRVHVGDVDASFAALALDLRVFPFKGALFIGVRAGRQWLDARARLAADPLGVFTEAMAASTWFINPRAGILHTFESGITLGVDAGVQLPVGPSYERSGRASAAGLAAQTGIDDVLVVAANALGNGVTPTLDLLRLGLLF